MKKLFLASPVGLLLSLILVFSSTLVYSALSFNDPGFATNWNRVDKAVQELSNAGRGYTWGPVAPGAEQVSAEPYNGGSRKVQYFDKARMEVNNPNGDPNNLFYVTTGLLVKELVTGARQDGDNTFSYLGPSTVQIAGDSNENGANAIAPTYASFKAVGTFSGTENGQPKTSGNPINASIDKSGKVSQITPPEQRYLATYDEVTRHNIADVFDQFANQSGPVWNGAAYVQGPVFFGNPLYVLGRPLTEPYWIRAVVAGVERDVLVQLFERRVLTYTPTNPAAFKVEMGNVGQHYFRWRYGNPINPTPTPSPTPGISVNTIYFPVGPGVTDVIPHQLVRTGSDRLYIFAMLGQYQVNLKAYWTDTPGMPQGQADFTRSVQISVGEQPLSVETAYDGANTIYVLVNTTVGNLYAYVFDTATNTFKSPALLASGNPTVKGDYIGTSGLAAMFDTSQILHVAYWSAGNHIAYRSYKPESAGGSLSPVESATQLDTAGSANHPALAISPLDGSLTVAWVSEASSPPRILARTLPAAGSWGAEEVVSTAPVWTSTSAGINIDQGPSLLIDKTGKRHLTYIENYDTTGSYGRVHYAASSGSGWSDTALDAYSHDPALALNSKGDLYIIGHGHPQNLSCKSLDDMCLKKQNLDGSWGQSKLYAAHSGSDSFDASPSVKWSVVGFNRPETIEFVFAFIPSGNYSLSQVYYGRIGS
jgi:hypothetical protein